MMAGGKTLAMRLRQLCIKRLPLGLHKTPEDSVTCGVGRRFQVITGSIWLERRDLGPWELEGGKLSHLIGRGIVDPADQDADVAQRGLLGQYGCPMLPQVWRGGFVLLTVG